MILVGNDQLACCRGPVTDPWFAFHAVDAHVGGNVPGCRVAGILAHAMKSHDMFDFMLHDSVQFLNRQALDKWRVVNALDVAPVDDAHAHGFASRPLVKRHPGHAHGDVAVPWLDGHQPAPRVHQFLVRIHGRFPSPLALVLNTK